MNSELMRPITDEELETFERDGVVWLRGILDLAWVTRLDETIEMMLSHPIGQTIDFTGLGMDMGGIVRTGVWTDSDKSWSEVQQLGDRVLLDSQVHAEPEQRGHYVSATDVWKVNPFLRQLALQSPIPKIAAALMRSKSINLYGDQVLVKPPGTKERTAWHQDLAYEHMQGWQVCGVRIPTTRETAEMGLVEYWRSSHKSRKIYKVNYFISDASDDDTGEPVPEILGHEKDYDLVLYAPEPGDVVVHHLGTLHGAGGNASKTTPRRAITLRYAGADVTYKFRQFAPPQDTLSQILREGDSLDGDREQFPRPEV